MQRFISLEVYLVCLVAGGVKTTPQNFLDELSVFPLYVDRHWAFGLDNERWTVCPWSQGGWSTHRLLFQLVLSFFGHKILPWRGKCFGDGRHLRHICWSLRAGNSFFGISSARNQRENSSSNQGHVWMKIGRDKQLPWLSDIILFNGHDGKRTTNLLRLPKRERKIIKLGAVLCKWRRA